AERVKQIVVARGTHRQTGGGRKFIIQSPHELVYPARKVHIHIEGLVGTVIAKGLRLMLVFITGEKMNAVLYDRATQRSAQLLVRIGEHALRYKIGGVERIVAEISGERAGEDIRSRLGDRIHQHAGRAPLAGVKPVLDDLKLTYRVPAEA